MAVGDIVSGFRTSNGEVNPTSGETWRITTIAANNWTGSYARVEAPNCEVGVMSGTGGNVALVRGKVLRSGSYYIGSTDWQRPLELFVTSSNPMYLYVANGTDTTGWRGTITATSSGVVNAAKCGVSSVSAYSVWNVQPSSGEGWCLTEIGVNLYSLRGTAPYSDLHDYMVAADYGLFLFDGTNQSKIRNPGYASTGGWASRLQKKRLRMYINNSVYMKLYNTNGSSTYMGYSGFRMK